MSSNSNTYAALPLLDLINRTKPFGHHQTNQDYESGYVLHAFPHLPPLKSKPRYQGS